MLSDVEMNNLSPVMANNKEAVQQVEGDRRESEKIHGGNHFAMIAKKGLPVPGKSWILGRSLHPAGDASLGYIEAQQEELAVNPGSSPGRIVGHHLEDEIPDLRDSFFLPTRSFTLEIRLQYLRKPARCQRTTVSGVTMMRELFQADQNRRAETQNSLSRGLSLGLGCLRFSTVSWWRSAKFSKSSVRCERKQPASSPNPQPEEAEHGEQS